MKRWYIAYCDKYGEVFRAYIVIAQTEESARDRCPKMPCDSVLTQEITDVLRFEIPIGRLE